MNKIEEAISNMEGTKQIILRHKVIKPANQLMLNSINKNLKKLNKQLKNTD